MTRQHLKSWVTSIAIGLLAALPLGAADDNHDMFQKGKALYQARKYAEALPLLRNAFWNDPANVDINFYYGLTAAATGDHESAAMAFDRILVINPDLPRVKLELARAYYNLKLYSVAEMYFREVVADQGVPPNVRANVQGFLSTIDSMRNPHDFSGMFSMSLEYDTNPTVSPGNSYLLPGFQQPVTSDEEDDWLGTYMLALNHRYGYPGKRYSWNSSVIAYRSAYDEQSVLDLKFFRFLTGPRMQWNDWIFSLSGGASHMDKHNDDYMRAYSGMLGASYMIRRDLSLNSALSIEDRKYYESEENDTANVRVALGPTYVWSGNVLRATVAYERNNADGEHEAYNRFEADFRYQRRLPYQITLDAGFRYYFSEFDETGPLYTPTVREDDYYEVSAGLGRNLYKRIHGEFRYRYVWTESNVPMYDYSRHQAAFTLTYRF